MSLVQATLCFILNRHRQCLMLRRNREPHKNQWNAPGGKLLAAEEPLQGCLREVLEETGLLPDNIMNMGYLDCVDAESTAVTWRLHLFTAEHPRVEVPAGEEGEFSWLDVDILLRGGESVVHNIPLILPLLLRGVPIAAQFVYRDDFLERYNISLICRGRGLPI